MASTDSASAAQNNGAPPDPDHRPSALLAALLMATPHLRAQFFSNPAHQIGKLLPRPKYWRYGDPQLRPDRMAGVDAGDPRAEEIPAGGHAETVTHSTSSKGFRAWWRHTFRGALFHPIKYFLKRRHDRERLAELVLLDIATLVETGKLASTVNTDAVFEDYFAPIVRTSQLGFRVIFGLSIGTFLAGLGLIGSGVYLVVISGTTNSTIVGTIFGGGGAITSLGSVYSMTQAGISSAATDHARLRMALTGFATELGQLRWLSESVTSGGVSDPVALKNIADINLQIQGAMNEALALIPATDPNAGGVVTSGNASSSFSVSTTLPADGATGVAIDSPSVRASFNANAAVGSVNADTFALRDSNGKSVDADVSYQASGWTAVLTPKTALTANVKYRAELANTVSSDGGVTLDSPYFWEFTTATS